MIKQPEERGGKAVWYDKKNDIGSSVSAGVHDMRQTIVKNHRCMPGVLWKAAVDQRPPLHVLRETTA